MKQRRVQAALVQLADAVTDLLPLHRFSQGNDHQEEGITKRQDDEKKSDAHAKHTTVLLLLHLLGGVHGSSLLSAALFLLVQRCAGVSGIHHKKTVHSSHANEAATKGTCVSRGRRISSRHPVSW